MSILHRYISSLYPVLKINTFHSMSNNHGSRSIAAQYHFIDITRNSLHMVMYTAILIPRHGLDPINIVQPAPSAAKRTSVGMLWLHSLRPSAASSISQSSFSNVM